MHPAAGRRRPTAGRNHTNAVVHAHSDLWLRLELRGGRLLISVRDRGSGRLRPVTPDLEAEGGRGLWRVEQLARA